MPPARCTRAGDAAEVATANAGTSMPTVVVVVVIVVIAVVVVIVVIGSEKR